MMKETTLDGRRDAFLALFDEMDWLESFHTHSYDGDIEETLIDIITYKEDSISMIWLYHTKALIIQAIADGKIMLNGTYSKREDLDKAYKIVADIAKTFFN